MNKEFQDENIWIIGASSGIGRSLALLLSKQGANIIVSARSEEKLKSLILESHGENDFILPMDIQNKNDVQNAVLKLSKRITYINRVIFMAGIYEPTSCNLMDIDKAHQIVDINLKGALNIMHYCLPILEKQKQSQLVLCASVAGYSGLPNGQPYSATKAAIINLAESLKAEYRNTSLDIKVINPGFVRTRLTNKNKFKMPFLIEPESAALSIINSLKNNSFEIHFPKKLTIILKMLRILPYKLYFWIISKLN